MIARGLALALLGACSAVGRPMAAGEWLAPKAPAAATCEVAIHEVDGMGPYERVQRFDAGGRLRYATTRLTYDGRGHEDIRWDASGQHVVGVDSYYEQDARRGYCEVIGGCDEPARRTIDHATWRWDEHGGLARARSSTEEFVPDRAHEGGWTLADDRSTDHRYRSEHGIAVDTDDLVVDAASGHPTAHEHRGSDRRYRDTFVWQGATLSVYRWMGYTQTFAYDARGRLAKQTLARAPDAGSTDTGDTVDTWTYDDAGRLAVHARDQYGGRDHHEWTWSYDAAGRLARETNGPGSTKDYTYGPTCPGNLNQPNLPTALRQANLGACVRSAGYAIDTCD